MIIYSDLLMPDWADGRAIGPVVQIRPSRRGDASILAHELEHVRQWREAPISMPLRYLFSRRWRLRYEVEASRAQLKVDPLAITSCAALLATQYRLGISFRDALNLLEETAP